MQIRKLLVSLEILSVAVLLGWCGQAAAYPTYHPDPPAIGCFACHPTFDNRGDLHDMHVGSSQMTGNCQLCHVSVGDNPATDMSGEGVSCIGCHLAPGLRAHHAAAGAPPDANGLVCADCHQGDPTPEPENTLPPYYSRTDVNLSDPCLTDTGAGGEDYSGDNQGLDNDGDLDYEADDSDCLTPVEERTWGIIKALYKRMQ